MSGLARAGEACPGAEALQPLLGFGQQPSIAMGQAGLNLGLASGTVGARGNNPLLPGAVSDCGLIVSADLPDKRMRVDFGTSLKSAAGSLAASGEEGWGSAVNLSADLLPPSGGLAQWSLTTSLVESGQFSDQDPQRHLGGLTEFALFDGRMKARAGLALSFRDGFQRPGHASHLRLDGALIRSDGLTLDAYVYQDAAGRGYGDDGASIAADQMARVWGLELGLADFRFGLERSGTRDNHDARSDVMTRRWRSWLGTVNWTNPEPADWWPSQVGLETRRTRLDSISLAGSDPDDAPDEATDRAAFTINWSQGKATTSAQFVLEHKEDYAADRLGQGHSLQEIGLRHSLGGASWDLFGESSLGREVSRDDNGADDRHYFGLDFGAGYQPSSVESIEFTSGLALERYRKPPAAPGRRHRRSELPPQLLAPVYLSVFASVRVWAGADSKINRTGPSVLIAKFSGLFAVELEEMVGGQVRSIDRIVG